MTNAKRLAASARASADFSRGSSGTAAAGAASMLGARGAGRAAAGAIVVHRRRDLPDVFRRRAAAAADEAGAGVDEPAGRTSPCIPASRDTGCGRRRRAAGRRWAGRTAARSVTRAIASTVSSMAAGPTEQFTPMTIRARPLEVGRERLDGRAVEAAAVLLRRHLRDDGQRRDAAHGANRREDLVQVAKRLEHEEIDAAFDQRLGLLAERRLGLLDGRAAPRLDAERRAGRSIRPPTPRLRAAVRAIARALRVDETHGVGQAEVGQLEPVGAERVRLDDVGARAHVLRVHLGDQIRLREVQLVEAAVEEDALGVQHRPHRAVTDEHALFEGVEEPLHRNLLGNARLPSGRPRASVDGRRPACPACPR